MRNRLFQLCLVLTFTAALPCFGQQPNPNPPPFRAGTATIDITPVDLPAIIAGMFLESQTSNISDPLFVRSFAFDDGTSKIAIAVVDTCMMPTSLIDDAKQQASERTGIPAEHMLVCATHTHSAPAAMGCLGTRQDEDYAARLPAQIADAIADAVDNLQPARIGWASTDDWEHTHNRRWIRRPENLIVDPFGNATGRAHMHPGYLSADIIGPSGPVDPALSVISVQTTEGTPLAVLANYSQHYFRSTPVSADYFGQFCRNVANLLGQPGDGNGPFVCAMSQGTSGDLMWMDYGAAKKDITSEDYSSAVADYAKRAIDTIEYRDSVTLAMVERRLALNYRVPDADRLAWAKPIAAQIENDLPKGLPEVYANEAQILHERQHTEVVVQALRIGDLTIATLPNEVYALTGLKLKGRSPAAMHFNIELANGAEGYIPPPEQHQLGGYTTWPARTAGLEVQAEPKIVEALTAALEEVTGRSRRTMTDEHGPYAEAILSAKPRGYWRLNDEDGSTARNAVDGAAPAALSPGFAWYLPGVATGTGAGDGEALTTSAFSGPNQLNRSIHLAGGDLRASVDNLGDTYSATFWFWLGEQSGASERSGTLLTGPGGAVLACRQDADHRVTLMLGEATSTTELPADEWHSAVLIRNGDDVRVHIDGAATPELSTKAASSDGSEFVFGNGLQGKLDEIAVFDRAISPTEIAAFWQASRVAESREPQPTEPAASLDTIHVPDGFRVELAASEPQVLDPVAFDWDDDGRLWVVEMADYPLGINGQGQPGGRVRVLEDRDNDGRFETSRLFADGLNFPNGILTWRDGILISAAPEILFLRDTDGDGIADDREVLLRGFHEGNQQLRVNGLRWGIDGWVYCANGGHHANYGKDTHIESTRTHSRLELGSRDFRFQPDTGAIEPESGPTQFGRNRDAWGHWFGTQNAAPLWHYVLPDRYSTRNPHVPTPIPLRHVVGPGSPPVFPASSLEKRYHSFEQSGRFTSACGGMIYNDERLFGPGDSLHAFTCEPFHNLVQHNVLDDDGVSYVSHRAPGEEQHDFFACEDRWCRPVMVRTGPDGALWVADMYRYMIEHPEWLPENGKAELLPHYRLGEDRGRIYRVVSDRVAERDAPRLSSLDTKGLVAALDSPNDWQRDKAQQLLLWKNDHSAVPMLEELVRSNDRPQTRVQSLWTLHVMEELSPKLLLAALEDAHPRVRENAVRIAEDFPNDPPVLVAVTKLADDPDAKVRLQLALSLGSWLTNDAASDALARLAVNNADEPFLVAAVMSSTLPHVEILSATILKADRSVRDAFREPLMRLALGADDTGTAVAMFRAAHSLPDADAIRETMSLLNTMRQTNLPLSFEAGRDDSLQEDYVAGQKTLLQKAQVLVADEDQPAEDRIAAASLLGIMGSHHQEGLQQLSQWLRPQVAPEHQTLALSALGECKGARVPELLAAAFPEFSPALRDQTLDLWLSHSEWTEDLLQRIESGEIPQGSLDPARRALLLKHPSPAVAQKATAILNSVGSPTRAKVLDEYRSVLTLPADAARGKAVFTRACATCHRRGDEGHDVGPNLATVIAHPPEKLLISILDPNAEILPGFQRYTCVLDSGLVLSGLLAAETSNSVTLKLADGKQHTLARSEIELLRNSGTSLMPEELEKVLPPQELADLIAWLRSPLPAAAEQKGATIKVNAR